MKQGTRYAKRLLNLMLVLAMVVSTFAGIVPATTIVASAEESTWDGQGEGTETSPYLIESLNDLITLSNNVASGMSYSGKYLQLTADIDCGQDNWTQIGVEKPFKGTFDGNGKTITYCLSLSNEWDRGLFYEIGAGGTVRNLKVSVSISATTDDACYIGGIASCSAGTIVNCAVDVNITGKARFVGGVIGKSKAGCQIDYCVVSGSIVWYMGNDYTSAYVGGIAGQLYHGSVTNCVALCDVIAESNGTGVQWFGRVVGRANANGHVSGCYYLDTATASAEGGVNSTGATAKTESELGAIGKAAQETYGYSLFAQSLSTHTHAWNYEANGNTITATCTGEGDCDYKTDGITLTLNAPTSLGYDGKAKAATVSGYPQEAPADLAAAPTAITYYPAAEKGSATIGGAALAGAPVEVGSYVACVTWGDQTASVAYTVVNYVSDYTVVIPSSLPVRSAGWNATEGLKAQVKQTTGYEVFAPEKCIAVTAASANNWALVSGENAIGYILTTAEGGEETTVWNFSAEELDAGTTKAMGIIVEDYSTAPMGTYTDTVTFTVSIEQVGDVRVSKEGEDDVLMSLADFRDSVDAGNTYEGYTVTLLHDVDLKNEEWDSIGNKEQNKPFSGIFDGAGYTVSNMKISNGMGDYEYSAFISLLKNGTVKNLSVTGSVTGINCSGVVARVDGTSTVENCKNYATIIGQVKAGGVVCLLNSGSRMFICANYGTVALTSRDAVANDTVGGIVAYANANTTISICTNYGDVSGFNGGSSTLFIGGVVGYATAPSLSEANLISNCRNEGDVYKDVEGWGLGSVIGFAKNFTTKYLSNADSSIDNLIGVVQ